MVTPQLVDYIKKTVAQGYPEDKVREALIKKGWVTADVAEAFRIARGEPRSAEAGTTPPKVSSQPAPQTPVITTIGGGMDSLVKPEGTSIDVRMPQIQPASAVGGSLHQAADVARPVGGPGQMLQRPVSTTPSTPPIRPAVAPTFLQMTGGVNRGETLTPRQAAVPAYPSATAVQRSPMQSFSRDDDATRTAAGRGELIVAPTSIPVRPAMEAQRPFPPREEAAADETEADAGEKRPPSRLKLLLAAVVALIIIAGAYVYFGSVYGVYAFGYNLFPFTGVADRVTALAEQYGLTPAVPTPSPQASASAIPAPTPTPIPTPTPAPTPSQPNVNGKLVKTFGAKSDAKTIGAAAYSADQTRVAYTLLTGTPNLWIMDLAGGATEDLLKSGVRSLRDGAIPVGLSWSHDGKKIAIVAQDDEGITDLYVFTIAAKTAINLTSATGPDASVSTDPMLLPQWSRDDAWLLAYVGSNLMRIQADGQQRSHITAGLPFGAFELAKDDSVIIYTIRRPDDEKVWIMDADGRNYRMLTPGGVSSMPRFNPDGAIVYYVSRDPQNSQDSLWSIKRDGTDLKQLIVVSGTIRELNIAPDGSRLLFIERSADGAQRLHIVRSNGLGSEEILPPGSYEPLGFAAWNAAGTAVLVAGMQEFLIEVQL